MQNAEFTNLTQTSNFNIQGWYFPLQEQSMCFMGTTIEKEDSRRRA